jgi:hypothetical protein
MPRGNMNLSHYQSMAPEVDSSDRQEGLAARSEAFLADDQAALLLLAPGEGALGLETGHHFARNWLADDAEWRSVSASVYAR